MRSVGLLLTLFVSTAASVQDHEWVLLMRGNVADDRGPMEMYVDMASIACDGEDCRALQRVVFNKPQTIPDTPPFDEMVTLQVLSCGARTLGTVSFTAYRGGERVDEQAGTARQSSPGRIGAAFDAVCSVR